MGDITEKKLAKILNAVNLSIIKLVDIYSNDNYHYLNKEQIKECVKLLNQLLRKIDKAEKNAESDD